METSDKIKNFRRSAPGLLIAVIFCALFILFAIYPYKPNNILAWLILFVSSLPIVLFLEYMGEILFENKIMLRAGRVVRIILGVFAVLLIGAIIIIFWNWVKPYMGTWS